MIPSSLNNTIFKGQNNLAPNTISGNIDSRNLNLKGGSAPDFNSLNAVLGNIIPTEPFKQPVYTPLAQPVAQPQMSQLNAIRSGNMNNPLNIYHPQLGQNYADAIMSGYNPVAEYQKLQTEKGLHALQNKGLYEIPEGSSPEQISAIRNSADKYYENQLGMTSGEAQDMISRLNETVTGGLLGTLPKATGDAVENERARFLSLDSTKNVASLQDILNKATGVYEKNKLNPGYADGSDDYRLLFLFQNSINPEVEVSQGDYDNAQKVMGAMPGYAQQWVSQYIKKDDKGNVDLSDMKNGFLSQAGRTAVYNAIRDHYKEGIVQNNFERQKSARYIDKISGRSGFGEMFIESQVNPENINETKSTQPKTTNTTNTSAYADEW